MFEDKKRIENLNIFVDLFFETRQNQKHKEFKLLKNYFV